MVGWDYSGTYVGCILFSPILGKFHILYNLEN